MYISYGNDRKRGENVRTIRGQSLRLISAKCKVGTIINVDLNNRNILFTSSVSLRSQFHIINYRFIKQNGNSKYLLSFRYYSMNHDSEFSEKESQK